MNSVDLLAATPPTADCAIASVTDEGMLRCVAHAEPFPCRPALIAWLTRLGTLATAVGRKIETTRRLAACFDEFDEIDRELAAEPSTHWASPCAEIDAIDDSAMIAVERAMVELGLATARPAILPTDGGR